MEKRRISNFPWDICHNLITKNHFSEDGAFGIEQLYERKIRRNSLDSSWDHRETQDLSSDDEEDRLNSPLEVYADDEDKLHVVGLGSSIDRGNLIWALEKAASHGLIIKAFRLIFMFPEVCHEAWVPTPTPYGFTLDPQFPLDLHFLTVRPNGKPDWKWHPKIYNVEDAS